MNIAIFTDTYYPQVNGVVTSIRMLEKELRKRGHQVYIFTTTYPVIAQEQMGVYRLPSMPLIFLPSYRIGVIYSPKVVRIIKNLNIDIVHTQTEFSLGFFGKVVARRLGVPVVHTYHTMYEDYIHYIIKKRQWGITPKIVKEFSKMWSKNYCNGCTHIVAPTDKVKELLKKYGVKREINIIPTGVDANLFLKKYKVDVINDLKKSYGIQPDDKVIIFVGRLAKEKSIDVIIKTLPGILKKYKNIKLLLVGEGPIRHELEEAVQKLSLGKSVIFAGEQPWENISKFYKMGDVFVTASVTETQGLTLIEAMLSGIPVVAKNDKNLHNIIIDGVTGRVFEDDNELEDIIFEIIHNERKTEEIVNKAIEKAKMYSSEYFGECVEELYKAALNINKGKKKRLPRIIGKNIH